jgi:hypothetical protein
VPWHRFGERESGVMPRDWARGLEHEAENRLTSKRPPTVQRVPAAPGLGKPVLRWPIGPGSAEPKTLSISRLRGAGGGMHAGRNWLPGALRTVHYAPSAS